MKHSIFSCSKTSIPWSNQNDLHRVLIHWIFSAWGLEQMTRQFSIVHTIAPEKKAEIFIRSILTAEISSMLPNIHPHDLFKVESWVHLGHLQFEQIFEKSYLKLPVYSLLVWLWYTFYLYLPVYELNLLNEITMGAPLLFLLTKGNPFLEFSKTAMSSLQKKKCQ